MGSSRRGVQVGHWSMEDEESEQGEEGEAKTGSRRKIGIVIITEIPGCSLLTEELRQIGFRLSTGEVERRLVSLSEGFFSRRSFI